MKSKEGSDLVIEGSNIQKRSPKKGLAFIFKQNVGSKELTKSQIVDEEFSHYTSKPEIDMNVDALVWWKMNSIRFLHFATSA